MDTQIYQILIDSSYDELPREAKHYVNRLVNGTSRKPLVSKILEGVHESAIKSNNDNIECLLGGAFINADQSRKVGCLWHFKTSISLLVFSLLTGVVIPKLLKQNYCLFLQSLVIASYLAKEGYVNESPVDWDYE